jgi:hypothetical protein
MKIEQSNVSLFSSHQEINEITQKESLVKWDSPEKDPRLLKSLDRFELSKNVMSMEENGLENSELDPKLQAIVRVLESLTGRKIDLSFTKRMKPAHDDGLQKRVGWGIDYHYERSEIHDEAMNFSSTANIKTEDGRSMSFDFAISMKNHTELHESLNYKAGDATIDPLVINFGADTVSLSNIKHSFDLNLDGKKEQFSFVGEGSGFLALDKNHDGIINDGSELFGPTKGNGFNELSAYDTDGNNWIDENDSVFKDLVIWTKDENGIQNLYSLKDKNVGALYLNKVDTQFDLKDSFYDLKGKIKESSIFLKETGGVGTLQELDLVV